MTKEEKQGIISKDSIRFCNQFISHINDNKLRCEWELSRDLMLSQRNKQVTCMLLINDVRVMFYHNKFAKDKIYTNIIKIGLKYDDLQKVFNTIPDYLASKEVLINEDYDLIVGIVLNHVSYLQNEYNRRKIMHKDVVHYDNE